VKRKLFLAVVAVFFLGAVAQLALGSSWTDQRGRQTETKVEQKQRKQRVALRNNLNDACDFLASDMMRRYYGRETAKLGVGSFVLTRSKKRCSSSSRIESRIAGRLEKTGKFEQLDRRQTLMIDARLYQKNKAEFLADPFYYKKTGRVIGADVFLHGTISIGRNYVGLTAKLVDVETEQTLTFSRVYVPKDKLKVDPVDYPDYKGPSNPYLVVFQYRLKPEWSLAEYLERRQIEQMKEYKTKHDIEELYSEEFRDVPDAVEEGMTVPEEDMFVDLDEDMDTYEDFGYEEEEVEPAVEEPTPVPAVAETARREEEEDYSRRERGFGHSFAYEEEEEADEEESFDTGGYYDTSADRKKKKQRDDEGFGGDSKRKAEPTPKPREKMSEYELAEVGEGFACGQIEIGDKVETRFKANQDGYAFLFSIDERANVKRLFPKEDDRRYAQRVERHRDYTVSDCLSKTPGCQRICLLIADKPFRLEVDRALLRRLACAQREVDLPWIKQLQPGSKFTQKTICFQQKETPKIGAPTPTPSPLPSPTPEPLEEGLTPFDDTGFTPGAGSSEPERAPEQFDEDSEW
jgi:hypothetical protein